MRPAYDDILRENAQLRLRVDELVAENELLKQQIVKLSARVEELVRQGKRQAAPFSKGGPKPHPKRPGRKAGAAYGTKARRPAPDPSEIDEVHDAPLPAKSPCCGAAVTESHVDHQYQVELPRRPIHRQFDVHVGHCTECGARLQGRHPLQTSDALGAAASQLGPNAQAAIAWLNKRGGFSHGKVIACLGELFGVTLSRGGSAQAMLRVASRGEPIYTELMQVARKSPWAVGDETGWRVGGAKAWLHVFVTEHVTVFVVDPTRSVRAAWRVLGRDYAGILVHDGWVTYDGFELADHQQCLRHIMGRCHGILETAVGPARELPDQVLATMKVALAVRDGTADLPAAERAVHRADAAENLEAHLESLVSKPQTDIVSDRLANHVWNHLGEWFTFLEVDGLDATNWRAEQAIRPGVVNRKVWGGNRTPRGARAQGVLTSILATCAQAARDSIDFFAQLLRGHDPPSLVPAGT